MKRITKILNILIISLTLILALTMLCPKIKTYAVDSNDCEHGKIKFSADDFPQTVTKTKYFNENLSEQSGYKYNIPYNESGEYTLLLDFDLDNYQYVKFYWFIDQVSTNYGTFDISFNVNYDQPIMYDFTDEICDSWYTYNQYCSIGENTLTIRINKYTEEDPTYDPDGRNIYIVPEYIPDFNENSICNQCGYECMHTAYEHNYNEDYHYLECTDKCKKIILATKEEHEFNALGECECCDYCELERYEDFYQIGTAGQLKSFAHLVNNGYESARGRLTADIDMTNYTMEPIGNIDHVYCGDFDGQGHYIYNLTMVGTDDSGTGLFGCAGLGMDVYATIHDLVIDKSCSFTAPTNVAALVGIVYRSPLYVYNVGNEADVTTTAFGLNNLAGGLVCASPYLAEIEFNNCYNTGNVTCGYGIYEYEELNYIYGGGGICGYLEDVTCSNCYNTGIVTTMIPDTQLYVEFDDQMLNSFAGYTNGVFENCYNYEYIDWGYYEINAYDESDLSDGTLVEALNGEANDYQEYQQGPTHPILFVRERYNQTTCSQHEYVTNGYIWNDTYSKCDESMICVNCGYTTKTSAPSTNSIEADDRHPRLVKRTHDAYFNDSNYTGYISKSVYDLTNMWSVTLHAEEASAVEDDLETYLEGIGATLPAYERYDYTFKGWKDNEELTGSYVTSISAIDTGDKEYWAEFEHNHVFVTIPGSPATCTEDGYTDEIWCPTCGFVKESSVTIKGDHVYESVFVVQPPTCSYPGVLEYVCKNDRSHVITEEIPIDPNNHALIHHDYLAPTTTKPGHEAYDVCRYCGYTTYVEIPKLQEEVKSKDNGLDINVKDKEGKPLPSDIVVSVNIDVNKNAQSSLSIGGLNVNYKKLETSKFKVAAVYNVDLFKVVGDKNVKIQPSDIAEGTVLTIKLEIPENVESKNIAKIIHIHDDGSTDDILDFKVEGNQIIFDASSFSEFAIVVEITNCVSHWLILAVVVLYGLSIFFVLLLANDESQKLIGPAEILLFIIDGLFGVGLGLLFMVAHCTLCFIFDGIGLGLIVLITVLWFVKKIRNRNPDKEKKYKIKGHIAKFLRARSLSASIAKATKQEVVTINKESIANYLLKYQNLEIKRRKDVGKFGSPMPDNYYINYYKEDGKEYRECILYVYNLKDDKVLLLVNAYALEMTSLKEKHHNIDISRYPINGKFFSIPIDSTYEFDEIAELLDAVVERYN